MKITFYTRKKKKELNLMQPALEVKPVLKINRTIVPQSYLNVTKHWDSNLYSNQEILNDL